MGETSISKPSEHPVSQTKRAIWHDKLVPKSYKLFPSYIKPPYCPLWGAAKDMSV